MSDRIFPKALGAAALAAAMAVAGPAHSLKGTNANTYNNACVNAWGASPGQDYCDSETLTMQGGDCNISGASCSITANVGDVSTTWTLTWSGTESPADLQTLDLCFSSTSSDGVLTWSVAMKTGCASGETTSSSATADGLAATVDD